MGSRRWSSRRGRRRRAGAAFALALASLLPVASCSHDGARRPAPRAIAVHPPAAPSAPPRSRSAGPEPIRWHRSVAVGSPSAGRLVRGVQLPRERPSFATWDPVLRRSPNRSWRRWGTDRLVRTLLAVAREYRRAHPGARRLLIGDLSRPHGGDFGTRFGPIGHVSHQNGLDADVYYPRADGRERAPKGAAQIDRRLSQALVDRFLARGAQAIFVGPGTGLTGPAGRVQTLANHDNHLHLRLRPGPPATTS